MGDPDAAEQEGGKQRQVVGDRDEVGERKGEMRKGLEPADPSALAVGEERLAIEDVEADSTAEQIREDDQESHAGDGIEAEVVNEQRERDEEAGADDRGQRRDGRPPHRRRGQPWREEKGRGGNEAYDNDQISHRRSRNSPPLPKCRDLRH